ncbi:MAG TPA: ABC transporter permease subunit [Kineosporiaceae bacterium]|nr:ABC transporter permease subunit [Kineosporiaceae bacterium]
MSTDVEASSPAPAAGSAGSVPLRVPGGSAWRLSWQGLRTVAVLELRQRVRSSRWVIVLVVWAIVLGALTALIRYAVHQTVDPQAQSATYSPDGTVESITTDAVQRASDMAGATMFGLIVFLVLGLAGLIAPALTATSVNGDRGAGVLATLQTTLLSPAEIVLGKLLAAWVTALALLAAAAPFILWAYLEGGTPAGRLLTTVGLVALILLVVCAIALGWSALTARTSTSAVLTYLSVAFLGLGLPVLFALSLTMVQQNETVTVVQPREAATGADGQSTFVCEKTTQEMSRAHTERVWWLLAANPFVVVADAAPRPADKAGHWVVDDPLSAIRSGVRESRLGPAPVEDWCTDAKPGGNVGGFDAARDAKRNSLGVVWPFGLAADLALGAGFTVVAVRRLRAPARKLPRGTRVA